MGLFKKIKKFGNRLSRKAGRAGKKLGKAIEKVEDGIKQGAGFAGSVSRVARQAGDGYDRFMGGTGGQILRTGLTFVPGGSNALALADNARGVAGTVEIGRAHV